MESEFVTWLGSPSGIAVAVLAGATVLFGILWFKSFKTQLRKWEADFGAKLADLGFPSWFTAAFTAASQGNLAEAFGDCQKAIKLSETPAGQAEVLAGLLMKAKADPSRWAIVTKIIADVDGGADPTADILDGVQASPWGKLTAPPTPTAVLKADLQSAVQHVQTAIANARTNGETALSHIHDVLSANDLGHLFPLVAAGAQAATASAVTAVAPVVAAAVPVAAPVVAAVASLGSTITIPDGHEAVVRAITPVVGV